ncbi:neural Wiskott-Aldrich syndrome protein-like [Meles meles]|uniref:neural Wiskott-Aldrich syndrome protein-like n=1 Tax=Meles meles TaxID=9662 RepID=UPI001E69CAE7|nr:neural Wiskott-Aldrich syndrome protein-like [Meles meles]
MRSPRGGAEESPPTPTRYSGLVGPEPPPPCLPNFGDPLAGSPGALRPPRAGTRGLKGRPPPRLTAQGPLGGRMPRAWRPALPRPRLASGPGPRAARCWLPAAAGFVPRADSPSRQPSPRLHPHPTRLVLLSEMSWFRCWKLDLQPSRLCVAHSCLLLSEPVALLVPPTSPRSPCLAALGRPHSLAGGLWPGTVRVMK